MRKILGLTGILLLAGILLIIWGKTPRYGKITKSNLSLNLTPVQKVKYENEYFSFSCQDDYFSRSEGNTIWLTGKSGVMESMTIMSRKFENDLGEDSGVMMRRVKKEDYSEEKINIAGVEGVYFVKKDLSERTVFVLNKGVLTSFSMTVNSDDEKYNQKFQEILDSWEWK